MLSILSGYQWVSKTFLTPRCRFFPTCSEYAKQAFETHGLLRGSVLTLKRLLRCHPWHPGGVDCVPPAK